MLTLVSGTTFAQILAILATPILTRFYDPQDFGLLALFLSITGIFGVISCLRYELSIMLPESDKDAANLLILSLLITLILSILIIPIIWVGKQPIQNILKSPELGAYLWLIPLFLFINGVFLALNYWNSRTKNFKKLSAATITSSIIGTGTQLGAGAMGYATGGSLIVTNLAGQAASAFILGSQIWKENGSLILSSLSWEKMKKGLIKYRKFPFVDSWSALLNMVSWQLPIFILSFYFSPIVVGFYSLGFRLLQLPMNFIGNSISQVFFQRATEAKTEGTLAYLVENVFKLLVTFGMFPILTLTIVGSDLFSVIFGENWYEAGVYAQILGIWAFIWFTSSPLSTLYIVLEKQKFGFKFNIANFITRLLSLTVGGFLGDVRIALFLFSISGTFVYGYLCLKVMLYSGMQLSHVRKIVYSNLSLFIPVGLILTFLKLIGVNQLLIVSASFLLCIIYYIYIIKTDSQIQSIFLYKSNQKKLLYKV